LKIYISQGSVATKLRCGGTFSNHFFYKYPTECAGENIMQIGQYFGNDMGNSL